jgi:hypothetical protein
MHVGVVHYLSGMKNSSIVIENVHMLPLRFYDPSCDIIKCALIIIIVWEWLYVFAVYIAMEQNQPLHSTGAVRTRDGFGFEG